MAKDTRTGLENSIDSVQDEYDIVKALIKASEYKEDDIFKTKISVKRGGEVLFSFCIRPLSDDEIYEASTAATSFIPNPTNPKLPKIRNSVDEARYGSALIYFATTDEDRARVWDNKETLDALGLRDPLDLIDVVLTANDKKKIVNTINSSGAAEIEVEEVIKN